MEKDRLLNVWLIALMNSQESLVCRFVVLKWRIVYAFEGEIYLKDHVDSRNIPLVNSKKIPFVSDEIAK